MKPTLLTLLLALSFSIYAQEPDPIIKEYNQKLTEHFRNHYDSKIQLGAYLQPKKNTDYNKLKLILSNVIHTESDKYSLNLADKICHRNKELTDWCHNKNIHQIRNHVDQKNLNTYLSTLKELESESEKSALLEKITNNINYNDSFLFYYVLETAQQIDAFNLQNKKLYKAYMGFNDQLSVEYIDEIQKDLDNSYLFINEYAIDDIESEMSKNASIIMAIGNNMAYATPSLRDLSVNCNKTENASTCSVIAEIQLHSKTIIDQYIGSDIKIKALKALNKDEIIVNEAELQKQRFSDAYTCYNNTKDLHLAMSLSQYFIKQYINDLLNYGEFHSIKNLALKIYEIQVDNGLVSDFDPNDCEK